MAGFDSPEFQKAMTLYDRIGQNYSRCRRSDPRIVKILREILSPLAPGAIPKETASRLCEIADIGAGTGSYARALAEGGYEVLAVEPSTLMRGQGATHPRIQWIEGYAENLPLPDKSVDAAIAILAIHHFSDYRQALKEMVRVTRGSRIILFTFDPQRIANFWLTEYFPSLVADVISTFVPLSTLMAAIREIAQREVKSIPFPLPYDLSDAFAAVGWARPELYLDPILRDGISSFAKMEYCQCERGLSWLREDLATGLWDRKYGYLRHRDRYDVGYRFVYTEVTQGG